MYPAPLPASSSMNNGMEGSMFDGSGTINPAALSAPVSVLPAPLSTNAPTNTRGQKRRRSPEQGGDHSGGGAEDYQKPKKRGRLPKPKLSAENPASPSTQQVTHKTPDHLRTSQLQPHGFPQNVSNVLTQKSPPKPTPTKTVTKAFPLIRDHTTDQLTREGDEYIPREYDIAGEAKVNAQGLPLGNRQFIIGTFYVADRPKKRFMLAIDCARALGYRDSYLLFYKNKSLFKIITSQAEKEDLIRREIVSYSCRSRQIAIVTAKSMFRQFGARVIEKGRRVRDDYWEAKAIEKGFTEEDLAGDKRPGAGRAREAASALKHNNPVDTGDPGQHQEIVYADPAMESLNIPDSCLGGFPPMTADSQLRAYGTIGDAAYSNAAENNKSFAQQRANRGQIMTDQQMMSPQHACSHQQQKDLQAVSSSYSGHGHQTSPYGYFPRSQSWGHPSPYPQPQQSLVSHYSPSSYQRQPAQLQQQLSEPQPPPQQQQYQQPQTQPQSQSQNQHQHQYPSQSPHPQQGQPQPQPYPSLSSSYYYAMLRIPPGVYSQAAAMAGFETMYPPRSASQSFAPDTGGH